MMGICKREGGKLRRKGETVKMSRWLFETTEICFGSTEMDISTRKAFHAAKKLGKSDFVPPEKYDSYTTALNCNFQIILTWYAG